MSERPPTSRAGDSRYSGWRGALAAFLLGLSPFVLLEASLWAIGYKSAAYYENAAPDIVVFRRVGGRIELDARRARHFRAAPFAAAKPAGVVRVFCVGDSVTAGFVRTSESRYGFLDDAYPERLGELYRRKHPDRRIEVINCGGSGYASYRLRQVVKDLLAYSPDAVTVMTGSSEFFEARHFKDWAGIRAFLSRGTLHWKTLSLARNLARRLRAPSPRMIQDDLPDLNSSSLPWIEQDLVRGGDEITAVVEHSTRNLAEMVNDCRAAGVPIFLCTAPANLRYASLQVPLDGNSPFANLARKAAEHVKTGRFREALARLEPELSAYREDYQRGAVLFFLAGQAYDGVRDFENARACYLRASDLDPLNWRAQTRLNEAIRRLAAGTPGAALIDVEQAFRWAVPDGIPDHRLFFDNCHPRPEGHQLIAETLLEALDARLPASSIQR